ncbi:hypothetical protein [Reyranella sp.]|jgi:hypothetical protein|uniref:hypothetical protein n=1 Tax=Reyranella sp. TaxID=1929291 RepID=UPI000BD9FF4C|nr:hypothetical protein [Reyranella sp.]OYY35553.1 MAG: hypothetical protein B7Y57_25575 [Rhodospirillales bacterium 35-66-84]OYZ91423.1 MAG: hypothetical protein B7Y08_25445 [Rhodospirillales bacterium 24-66-33]OZB26253.1 MAG: hypothetical protein B7X63_09955 [Rhodospirillales bacterium 39-66-50]HQS15027.1 hypothetical protein [Reyranella sp.]HQT10836.1 hypothetical protein [Reyranella sp.]
MLTAISWLWAQPGGRTTYAARHVNAWAAMVRRHLTLEHEIAVVTDMPAGIDPGIRIIPPPGDFEDVRLPTWGARKPQCLRRLAMFERSAADWLHAERVVSMDLDCVIADSLDPLFDTDDDFRIAKGTATSRRYNGSLMMLRLGARPQVFDTFTREKAVLAGLKHLGSDQAWIASAIPNEKTWGAADGVRFWTPTRRVTEARVVFFAGAVGKPWEVDDPLVARHYPAMERGAHVDA